MHFQQPANMFVILIYFLVFQSCLQNVLLEKSDKTSIQSSGKDKVVQSISAAKIEESGKNLKIDDENNKVESEHDSTSSEKEDEEDEDGPLSLKLLSRFLNLKGGLEDGAEGPIKILGKMHKLSRGLADILKDSMKNIKTLLPH